MELLNNTLDLFFEKTRIGIATFNVDLTLSAANPRWRHYLKLYFKCQSNQLKEGAKLFDMMPEGQVQLQPLVNQALNGMTVGADALPFQKENNYFYWNIEVVPATKNKEVYGFLFIINDVTEKVCAERDLLNAQNALLTLMGNLPGMAYRGGHNRNRIMELVNDGASELTGYPSSEFLAQGKVHYGSLIHPQDINRVNEILNSAARQKRPFEIIYRIYTKNSTIKWVLERGAPLLSHEKELLALEGFVLDITERVLSQQLLERRVADRTRKLSTMYEVMAVAAKQVELQKIFDEVLPDVIKAVHANAGTILMADEEKRVFRVVTNANLPKSIFDAWNNQPIKDTGLGKILVTQEMQSSEEIDLRINELDQLSSEWPTFLGLPIMAHQRSIGVLIVLRTQKRSFSESDIALLDAVADQLGATIENDALRQDHNRLLVVAERNRLARELHDAVTHSLYSLTLFAEATQRYAQTKDFENVQLYTLRMQESAQHSLREMRLLLHNLRPPSLEKYGLIGAIHHRLEAVEERSGVQYQFIAEDSVNLPSAIEEAFWHVTEEALNNALKHAQCSKITVELSQEEHNLTLTIADDGCGIVLTGPDNGGQGLKNMQERLSLLGGTLTIGAVDSGTLIKANVDLGNYNQSFDIWSNN